MVWAEAAAVDGHGLRVMCLVTDVAKERAGPGGNRYCLQQVEQDFRQMKTGLLEVRPVFVRKESRTRGHVFCCLLALKISREMKRRLQGVFGTTDADPHATTPADAITALSRLCLLEYQIDDKTTVTRLPKPDARQKQILEALQVHLPQK